MSVIDFSILGPLRVVAGGVEVPIPSRRQRALLVLLLMSVGRAVPSERLIDHLWDGQAPPQAAVTLRAYISNLRQALREGSGGNRLLVTRGAGYCLDVPRQTVDAVRLTQLAEEGRESLRAGRSAEALVAFDAATQLWTGDPLAEIADHEVARSTITHLTETYLGAVEGKFQAQLETGRHHDAIPSLDAFAREHPLREEPQALLMLGLYRAGRAPEALEAHRRFRARLQEELGIDPSQRLDELTTRILSQDPALDLAPGAGRAIPAPVDTSSRGSEEVLPARVARRSIVGRDRELAVLQRHLDRTAREGVGALVLIGGEPGIGKSTLLEAVELAARERRVPVHRGRSPAESGAPAFWPWAQVVESMAGALDEADLRAAVSGAGAPVTRLSATLAERAGGDADVAGISPQSQRFILYEAVSAFLRQATNGGPVLITLDDIHWADQPTLELLSYLTPTLASRPVLLVATYRNLPGEWTEALVATLATVSREDVAEELAVQGLGTEEVAVLAADLLQGEDADKRSDIVSMLHDRTGGNPFFVRQLARLMLDSDAVATDPRSVPVPSGVRHVIARRLRALPMPTQDLLGAAAVIGREFDLRTAAEAAGMSLDEALDAFDLASAHGLVDSSPATGERRFVHALVQDVVREGLPPGRAARLHADVAAQLERDRKGTPDDLARHLWAARDIAGRAAVPALQAAAEAAAAVYAHEHTELHLRRALSILRVSAPTEAETELTLLLSLFRLVVSARGWGDQDARAMVDRAMELAGAGTYSDASAGLWWSLVFYLLDRDDPAYVDVAFSLLESGAHNPPGVNETPRGPAARAAVHLMSIFAALARDERDDAVQHLQRARDLVVSAPNTDLAAYDEHLHVMLLLIEGFFAALRNDAETHRATTEAAVALADADGRPFPRTVARTLAACAAAPYLDDVTVVGEVTEQAMELAGRYGFAWLGTLAETMDEFARALASDRAHDAVERVQQLLTTVEKAGHHGNAGTLLLMLARLHATSGEDDAARAALVRARSRPGPYAGLVVDLVDRRLAALEPAGGAGGADATRTPPPPNMPARASQS